MLSTAAVTWPAAAACSAIPRLTEAIIFASAVGRFDQLFRPGRLLGQRARARRRAAPHRFGRADDLRRANAPARRPPCGRARRDGLPLCAALRMSRAARALLSDRLRDLLGDLAHLRRSPARCWRPTSPVPRSRLATSRACSVVVAMAAVATLRRPLLLLGAASDLGHHAGDLAEAAEDLLQPAGARLGQRVALVGHAHAFVSSRRPRPAPLPAAP